MGGPGRGGRLTRLTAGPAGSHRRTAASAGSPGRPSGGQFAWLTVDMLKSGTRIGGITTRVK
ncbi:hypothetical protein TBS_09540 [Thermobispora bispora]|jgi:hypothetical protein